MMSTLQVPKMSVPGVYIKRGNSMSSLESAGSTDMVPKPSRQLLNGKANGAKANNKSNGLGIYLDNIAFELGDESTTDSVEEDMNTTSNVTSSPPVRLDVDKDNGKECEPLSAPLPKDEISFTMNGERPTEGSALDERQRKPSDTSLRSENLAVTPRQRKSVQILDIPQVKQVGSICIIIIETKKERKKERKRRRMGEKEQVN